MPVKDQNKQRNAELVIWKSLCKTIFFEILNQIDAYFSTFQIKVFISKFLFGKIELNILILTSIELQVFDP